jgi:RNA polymerase sigma-70 factor (ECF subfamily)
MRGNPDAERFEHLVRGATGRVLATLIGQLRDIDLAEEALGDALLLAAEHWPRDGIPDAPDAWLLTVARRRAIDRIRRERQRDEKEHAADRLADGDEALTIELAEERWRSGIDDDRLRLIFTCCHPALAPDARIALTLRTVAGLETAEIARAFLVPEPTMAQRLVRAKRKIKLAGIPYRVPEGHELPDRLPGVLRVVYLVFNEGYLASRGDDPVRLDLAVRAIELARLLAELMPDEPEVLGLLALLEVQHARRDARFDDAGDLVTSEHQDRSRFHHDELAVAEARIEAALGRRSPGPYQLQAAIAVLGATAPSFAATDWRQIAALYGELFRFEPTPVVELNRAVAVSYAWGPEEGLALVDGLVARGALADHHLLHATRAELFVRAGRPEHAGASFARALELTDNPAERRHLARRLDAVGATA